MSEQIIHIGYPKTASSWLQRFVFNNNKIGLETISRGVIQAELLLPNDLQFDEDKAFSRVHSEIEKIKKEGKTPVLSHEHFSGHAQSGGYYNYNLAKRLKNLFREAKVIIVIRNQLDMIYSSYLHYIKTGGRCNIKRFLNPPKDGIVPLFRYEYFEYHKLIKIYRDFYGKENVLVLPYELFLNKPRHYVEEIATFVKFSLPSNLQMPFKKIENKSIRGIGILLKRYANRLIFNKSSVNPDVPVVASPTVEWLIRGMINKFSDLIPKPINRKIKNNLVNKIRKNINGRYSESNEKTAKMIQRNLRQYNYELKEAPVRSIKMPALAKKTASTYF